MFAAETACTIVCPSSAHLVMCLHSSCMQLIICFLSFLRKKKVQVSLPVLAGSYVNISKKEVDEEYS